MNEYCEKCGKHSLDCDCRYPECQLCKKIIYAYDGICICVIKKDAEDFMKKIDEDIKKLDESCSNKTRRCHFCGELVFYENPPLLLEYEVCQAICEKCYKKNKEEELNKFDNFEKTANDLVSGRVFMTPEQFFLWMEKPECCHCKKGATYLPKDGKGLVYCDDHYPFK